MWFSAARSMTSPVNWRSTLAAWLGPLVVGEEDEVVVAVGLHLCHPKDLHKNLNPLLRGTRDRWAVQVSFITNYSTGLAPFPRLSAPPHSPHKQIKQEREWAWKRKKRYLAVIRLEYETQGHEEAQRWEWWMTSRQAEDTLLFHTCSHTLYLSVTVALNEPNMRQHAFISLFSFGASNHFSFLYSPNPLIISVSLPREAPIFLH